MAAAQNRRETTWEVWYSILEASRDLYSYLGVTPPGPLFFSDKTSLNKRDTELEIQMKVLAIYQAIEGT